MNDIYVYKMVSGLLVRAIPSYLVYKLNFTE